MINLGFIVKSVFEYNSENVGEDEIFYVLSIF